MAESKSQCFWIPNQKHSTVSHDVILTFK